MIQMTEKLERHCSAAALAEHPLGITLDLSPEHPLGTALSASSPHSSGASPPSSFPLLAGVSVSSFLLQILASSCLPGPDFSVHNHTTAGCFAFENKLAFNLGS